MSLIYFDYLFKKKKRKKKRIVKYEKCQQIFILKRCVFISFSFSF